MESHLNGKNDGEAPRPSKAKTARHVTDLEKRIFRSLKMWCTLEQTIITLVPTSGHFDFPRESSLRIEPTPVPPAILKNNA